MRTLHRENIVDDPHREFRIHQHMQRIGKLLRQEREKAKEARAVLDPAPTFTYCKTCLKKEPKIGGWVIEGIHGSVAHWCEPTRNGCCKRTTVCKKTLTLLVKLEHVMEKWGRRAE